ncbi:hypothetical protein BGZ76_002916, partial [Entomortierella beljakovae]
MAHFPHTTPLTPPTPTLAHPIPPSTLFLQQHQLPLVSHESPQRVSSYVDYRN